MKRFIEGEDRNQSTLFPECTEDNPVRIVDELDLGQLGFGRVDPKVTGRPAYHSSMLQQVQGGEQPRQELYACQDEAASGADRGKSGSLLRPVHGELRVCTMTPAFFQSCNP
jgi:hypothetical protein